MRKTIIIPKDDEKSIIEKLNNDDSMNSQRIRRLLAMPDLSRQKDHPIQLLVERITSLPRYEDFDIIEIPEIVSTQVMFDTYNFPKDHPARSASDTYYADQDHVLRPHTTIMRWYYLESEWIRKKLEKDGSIWVISYWKVYRKDEIDRSHHTVFHNIDAVYICKKEKQLVSRNTLEDILGELIKSIYQNKHKRKFVDDQNPYTDPTVEIEVDFNWKDLEILGSWVLRPELIELLGLDPEKYNAWAWGPWLERILMPKMNIPDIRIFWSQDERITKQRWNLEHSYEEVSKYPASPRDISFLVPKSMHLNNYYTLIRDIADDIVEEVILLDKYENDEKFWSDMISYTFRIVYRSHDRTLTNDEVNEIQFRIRKQTEVELGAELR